MTQDTATRPGFAGADTDTSARRLIASNRVEGTPVYNRSGDKLGRIESIMIDKRTGRAEHAVLSFGGIFGFADSHYPLPWAALEYDTGKGGYIVDLAKEKLEKGPSFRPGDAPEFDQDYGRTVYDYYGVRYTW